MIPQSLDIVFFLFLYYLLLFERHTAGRFFYSFPLKIFACRTLRGHVTSNIHHGEGPKTTAWIWNHYLFFLSSIFLFFTHSFFLTFLPFFLSFLPSLFFSFSFTWTASRWTNSWSAEGDGGPTHRYVFTSRMKQLFSSSSVSWNLSLAALTFSGRSSAVKRRTSRRCDRRIQGGE